MEFRKVPHLNRLVIAAPNWLGDAVMALPAVADVRRTWPEARLAVAARASVAGLFSLVREVDDVVVLPAAGASRAGVETVQQLRGFDAAILLPNSFHIALAARRAGVPERWGYRADWRGMLLTRAIARRKHGHQVESYRHLVHELGCESGPEQPRLEISGDVRQAGAEALRGAGWDGRAPVLVLAPGAAYGGAKRWPARSFAAVASDLAAHDEVACVLIGASADRSAGVEVEAATDRPLLNLIGKTDLRTLAGVLALSRGLVTNDSGAMHLAAAIGVPVTAMFGPTRETETHPIAAPGAIAPIVLTHNVWCRPCMLRECPIAHGCMHGISTQSVLTAARRSL
jgi:heptosyltransferase II